MFKSTASAFLAAAGAAAAAFGSTSALDPLAMAAAATAATDQYTSKRRLSRDRTPWGNTVKFGGVRYHNGTAIVAGVPGSKLARKAAEGRLGTISGRRSSAVSR